MSAITRRPSQGRALLTLRGEDSGLRALSLRVRSGDAGNLESVAAVRYWPRLFGDTTFRRGDEGDARNALLNYGYTIARAAAARALCAAGLHPTLGVHHANRNNAFCLADDFMEPLRPVVDVTVAGLCEGELTPPPLGNATALASILTGGVGRFEFPHLDAEP
ncbi:MAG: type II CRISPR-associated endonuclease Cas1 [Acidobacteria bacterium]|nr:type II CRISPR-associated endonuclease Cas1 [Acidobacteriota bacterium]